MEGLKEIKEIVYDDFAKLDIRVAKIENVEDIAGADKLYKLSIDIGLDKRVICAGIKQHYSKEELRDRKIIVLTNLAPRKLKGIESQGMLLAASDERSGKILLLSVDENAAVGSKVS